MHNPCALLKHLIIKKRLKFSSEDCTKNMPLQDQKMKKNFWEGGIAPHQLHPWREWKWGGTSPPRPHPLRRFRRLDSHAFSAPPAKLEPFRFLDAGYGRRHWGLSGFISERLIKYCRWLLRDVAHCTTQREETTGERYMRDNDTHAQKHPTKCAVRVSQRQWHRSHGATR